MEIKINYTREELMELCKKGRVLYNFWMDRDSYSSQKELMMAHLLLESECDFKIRTKENQPESTDCITNEDTVWIEIYFDDWEEGEDWHTFYIPTEKRLNKRKGVDWY